MGVLFIVLTAACAVLAIVTALRDSQAADPGSPRRTLRSTAPRANSLD